jgi:hypothetical protein
MFGLMCIPVAVIARGKIIEWELFIVEVVTKS